VLTDLMSPAVLAFPKDTTPAGPSKGAGKATPSGGWAFENTLRRVLSQERARLADESVDSTKADKGSEETDYEAEDGQVLTLSYLGYVPPMGLGSNAANNESSTPADAVDQADAELEAAVSISGILGKASRTAAGVEGAFPESAQLHPEAEGFDAAQVGGSWQKVSPASDAAADESLDGIAAAPAFAGVEGVSLGDGSPAGTQAPGVLGKKPFENEASFQTRNTALSPRLTGTDNDPAVPLRVQRFQRMQRTPWAAKRLRTASGLLAADEGAGSSRGIRTEALKGALEEAGVEIKHKALLFSGELSEAEDAVQQGMDLAKEVLAAAQAPGRAFEAPEVGIEGQIALRQETENLVPSEINTGLDAVSDLAQFSTGEIDDPSHAAFSQQETGLNAQTEQAGDPGQDPTAPIQLAPAGLSGYEAVMDMPVGQTAADLNDRKVNAGSGQSSRNAASFPRGVEGQGNALPPETESAPSIEGSGRTMAESDYSAIQDDIPDGQETANGGRESRAKDGYLKADESDLQASSRLGDLGEQAAHVADPSDAGFEQPAQSTALSPQQRAQEAKVSSNQVMEQIVRGIELNLKGEYGEIRLQLKPDSLGEVEVRIASNNGIVSAEFIAESQRVKALIEAGLPQLKQQLIEQGLNVQELSVQVGGGSTYSRDPYSRSAEPDTSGIWWHSGERLVSRAGESTQIRYARWGSTIDYRV